MESQRIAGRYQVLRPIGRGGMGTVWLCRDEVLGREVAVKQVGGMPGEQEVETARALREARSAAALNHPNVVSVYDVVDHDARPWLVMEYVAGQTLAEVLAERGRLPPEQVADIGARLAGALARAHERRIVHRDIKPGNVLMDAGGRPKISDFGIARTHGDEQLTQTGFVTGTPAYLSPELARGGDPTPASDVWALGATLYTAVEGQGPYAPRPNPLALLGDIATQPPRPMQHAGVLAPVIAAMMERDPARRPDMVSVAQGLAAIARGGTSATAAAGAAAGAAGAAATQVLPGASEPEATRPMPRQSGGELTAAAAGPGDRATGDNPAVPPPVLPPAPPAGGRGPRRWLVPVLVLVVLGSLGAAYLLARADGGGRAAATGSRPPAAPATTASRASATTSSAPRTSRATTTSSSPTSSATAATTAPATKPAGGDKALAGFVKSYFAEVTKDRDRTWQELTPRMQAAAGGRSGYDGFWSTISSVKVRQTRADAATGVVVATLTYTLQRGGTSTETHQLTVVTQGGSYLIDSDHRIG